MDSKITEKTWVILSRSGVRKYIDEDLAQKIQQATASGNPPTVITIDGESIGIIGSEILRASTLEDRDRRKNGEWQCRWNLWHPRGEKCDHHDLPKTSAHGGYVEFKDTGGFLTVKLVPIGYELQPGERWCQKF